MVLLRFRHARIAVGLALVAGCAAPRQKPPAVDPNTLGDVEFQAYLADAPLVTVDEAFRAILILADGQDTSKTFEERKQKLESRGISRAAWHLESNNMIDKGTVAYMVCKICRIRGGINMMVLGTIGLGDRHYALRELVYDNLADDTSEFAFIRGGEFVSLLSKADDYMRKHKLYEGAPLELPPEPKAGENPETWIQGTVGTSTQPGGGAEMSPVIVGEPSTQPAAPSDAGSSQSVPATPG